MGSILDLIKNLGLALIPPRDFSDAARAYKWSMSVSITLVLIGGLTMANTLLAWGLIPAFYAGFATAGDLKTQQMQLAEIRVTQIENAIKLAKVQNCVAQREGNMPALNYSADDLAKRLTEYFQITGHPYPRIPECAELIAERR